MAIPSPVATSGFDNNISFSGPSGSEHREIAPHREDLTVSNVQNIGAEATSGPTPTPKGFAFCNQVDADAVRKDLDIRLPGDLLEKRSFDRKARQVICVQNAPSPVAALTMKIKCWAFGRVSMPWVYRASIYISISSRTRAGPSRTQRSTTASLQSPAPATLVSRWCSSKLSLLDQQKRYRPARIGWPPRTARPCKPPGPVLRGSRT